VQVLQTVVASISGIKNLKDCVSLLRDAIDALPDSDKKKQAVQALLQAEQQFKIAEAEAARGLGYEICQSHWPPEVMLLTGQEGHYRCPQCGREIEPPAIPVLSCPSRWKL